MPTGTVKWFSDDKGFGFITPDDGDKDLFVHHTGINGEGYRSLQEGAKVSYDPEQGDKGPKAVNVTDHLSRGSNAVLRGPASAGPRRSATAIVATLRCRATRQPFLYREHPRRRPPRRPVAGGEGRLARSRRFARGPVGALALALIVLLSLFVVVMAADRPSVLSPTTHNNFFPRWMAGPLGGLWPGLTSNGYTLKYLVHGGDRGHVRELSGGAAPRLRDAGAMAHRGDPRGARDLPARAAARADGRLQLHQLRAHGGAPPPQPVHDDPDRRAPRRSGFVLSNWHQLLSPYGPLFTLLTFAVVPLGVAGSFWALKVLLMLASLAMIALVWRCAKLLGRDPRPAIALVGLNPIVLVWGLGGDHNDFLMLLCIVLGFYLLLLAPRAPRGRRAASARGSATGCCRCPPSRSVPARRSSPPPPSRPPVAC